MYCYFIRCNGYFLGANAKGVEALGLTYYWHSALFGASIGAVILLKRFNHLKLKQQDYIMLAIMPMMGVFVIGVLAGKLEGEVVERLVNIPAFELLAYFFAFMCFISIGFVGMSSAKRDHSIA